MLMRWLFLFLSFSVIFGAAVFIWWQVENEKRRRRVVRSLAARVDPDVGEVRTSLLIDEPALRGALASFFRPRPLSGAAVARTAGSGRRTAKLLLVSLAAAIVGFIAGKRLEGVMGPLAPVIVAVVAGAMPRIYRDKNHRKRVMAIEEQFPEALDFLARSVRAGNAFSVALELFASDAADPLKSEFLKVIREMALGAGLEDALHGLIQRLPVFEVQFFVSAVLLQRETGGNLSEVLSKLSAAVRERVRLRGQVKAASGQGRLTAKVLTFLPVATMVMLKVVSPAYLDALTDDPIGRNLLAAAVVSQTLGYLVMQKVAKVEV